MPTGIQHETNDLIRKLQRIEGVITKDTTGIFKDASRIIISAIKGRAPMSDRAHKRYSNGNVVATYKPGNLRRSIQVLPLRRVKRAVVIGPRARGGTPDGYYARFLEFGTVKMSKIPFVGPAVEASYGIAQKFTLELLKRRIEKYAEQNGVK